MNEFHDPELERLLGGNGGPFPDVNLAYERVQGRVRQVKRRRAIVASGAACVVLFGAAVLAGARAGDSNSVSPAGTGQDDSSSSSSTTGTGTLLTPGTTVVTASTTATGSTVPGATVPGATVPGAVGTATTTAGGTSPTTNPVVTAAPTTDPPVTAVPAPVTRTFSGVGGSITVRLENGSLSLVGSPSPTSGFTVEIRKSGGTRVEVRFDSASNRTDIRVDIVNGVMSPQVDES